MTKPKLTALLLITASILIMTVRYSARTLNRELDQLTLEFDSDK